MLAINLFTVIHARKMLQDFSLQQVVFHCRFTVAASCDRTHARCAICDALVQCWMLDWIKYGRCRHIKQTRCHSWPRRIPDVYSLHTFKHVRFNLHIYFVFSHLSRGCIRVALQCLDVIYAMWTWVSDMVFVHTSGIIRMMAIVVNGLWSN